MVPLAPAEPVEFAGPVAPAAPAEPGVQEDPSAPPSPAPLGFQFPSLEASAQGLRDLILGVATGDKGLVPTQIRTGRHVGAYTAKPGAHLGDRAAYRLNVLAETLARLFHEGGPAGALARKDVTLDRYKNLLATNGIDSKDAHFGMGHVATATTPSDAVVGHYVEGFLPGSGATAKLAAYIMRPGQVVEPSNGVPQAPSASTAVISVTDMGVQTSWTVFLGLAQDKAEAAEAAEAAKKKRAQKKASGGAVPPESGSPKRSTPLTYGLEAQVSCHVFGTRPVAMVEADTVDFGPVAACAIRMVTRIVRTVLGDGLDDGADLADDALDLPAQSCATLCVGAIKAVFAAANGYAKAKAAAKAAATKAAKKAMEAAGGEESGLVGSGPGHGPARKRARREPAGADVVDADPAPLLVFSIADLFRKLPKHFLTRMWADYGGVFRKTALPETIEALADACAALYTAGAACVQQCYQLDRQPGDMAAMAGELQAYKDALRDMEGKVSAAQEKVIGATFRAGKTATHLSAIGDKLPQELSHLVSTKSYVRGLREVAREYDDDTSSDSSGSSDDEGSDTDSERAEVEPVSAPAPSAKKRGPGPGLGSGPGPAKKSVQAGSIPQARGRA